MCIKKKVTVWIHCHFMHLQYSGELQKVSQKTSPCWQMQTEVVQLAAILEIQF